MKITTSKHVSLFTPFIMAISVSIFFALATPASPHTIKTKVSDEKGGPVYNAVVYAYPVNGTLPELSSKKVIVDQIDKEFQPSVTAITAGTPVYFPNDDDIRHHVYSLSKAKMFELPLYSGRQAHPVVFDKPGVVALGCNIHDWMIAYIYVLETPFFSKTDHEGNAVVEGLPEGEYRLFLWHPWMKGTPDDYQNNAVTEGKTPVNFTVKLKANIHIRRAPVLGGVRY